MRFKLGKRPARPGAIPLKFSSYFHAAALPPVPAVFGRPQLVSQWGMLGNNLFGDCYWAGAAHETMLLFADNGVPAPLFGTSTVLADYSAATGFKSSNPASDQGTDLGEGAEYRQKIGITDGAGNRHRVDLFAALRVGDLDQIALATFLLGVAGIGVELPSAAEEQFDQMVPWSPVPNDKIEGGHYIPCVGRNAAGNFLFVSWGRLQAATPHWVQTYMDEGVAYMSVERLNAKGLSPQGYDQAALVADYRAIA
jgi:hypothetical protein